jgi:UDPglucose 6-dehydrogenase
MMPGVTMMSSALEAAAGSDAIVLVTEWEEFGKIDWTEMARATEGRLVIDGRNFMDGAAARAAGFTYEGIGR